MEGPLAPFASDIAERSTLETLVGLGVRVADHVVVPPGEPGEHARFGQGRLVFEPGHNLGVTQFLHAGLGPHVEVLHPAGELEEGAERAEAHIHADENRHGERHDLGSRLVGFLAGFELVPVGLRSGRVNGEDIPVDGPIRGERHLGHQFDLVVVEPVQATVSNPFERGSLVLRRFLAQGEDLFPRSPSARYRLPVGVGVGERPSG